MSAVVRSGPVRLLVGTSKGAFSFDSDQHRRHWRRRGPMLAGWRVDDLVQLPSGRLLAATSHLAYGATVRISDDGGDSWRQVAGSPRFNASAGRTVGAVWRLVPVPSADLGPTRDASGILTPDGADGGTVVFAGTSQEGLFVSTDQGESFAEVHGSSEASGGPEAPGTRGGSGAHGLPTLLPPPDPASAADGGGCVHSVVTGGGQIWVAGSRAGVLRSDDGGATWTRCPAPDPSGPDPAGSAPRWSAPVGKPPASGHPTRRTHKLAADPSRPGTLFLQAYAGTFRSHDGGDTWRAVHAGLPSDFGFPVAVDHTGAVWTAPLAGARERYMPGGRLAVYRSGDAGATWQERRDGMPDEPHFVAVLRDALTTDDRHPVGVYAGTTSGEVYASADAGGTWRQLPGRLTRVTSLRAVSAAG